eukprot:7389295-Prymnesium_polylepis.2
MHTHPACLPPHTSRLHLHLHIWCATHRQAVLKCSSRHRKSRHESFCASSPPPVRAARPTAPASPAVSHGGRRGGHDPAAAHTPRAAPRRPVTHTHVVETRNTHTHTHTHTHTQCGKRPCASSPSTPGPHRFVELPAEAVHLCDQVVQHLAIARCQIALLFVPFHSLTPIVLPHFDQSLNGQISVALLRRVGRAWYLFGHPARSKYCTFCHRILCERCNRQIVGTLRQRTVGLLVVVKVSSIGAWPP